ncbi:J domain-containing protein [Altericroceibacterium xinjiangense]|uniref:J domain-containing protein n=1 Tax=Altericroceibacterium xinjiangense TaxID=762261 RepID=UPI001F4996EC|nr:J domain-containing protein [Altericroceibacterium xinjiangense]
MTKLILFLVLLVIAWRMLSGRWVWEKPGQRKRVEAERRARSLLEVRRGASREEIVDAHRRLVARVHPDKGGTGSQFHEANEARDLLLRQLPKKEHV